MKRRLPWIIAAVFAVAFVVVLIGRGGSSPNEISGVTQDGSGRRIVTWVDPMYSQGPPHLYKSNHPGVAPDCGMKLVPQYADESGPAVATTGAVSIPPQRQQLIGVKLATAEVRDLSRVIRTTGRVAVDERRTAQIRTKFEGFIDTLYVNFTGQPVRRGEPLAAIYSPDLLATQNDLVLAERNQSDLGRTLADAARTRLRLWDMSTADIERVARTSKPMRDVVLRSPVSGVVITKNAVAGARVMPTDTLYEIADLSRVWVVADVYESELASVRIGTPAQVVVSGQTLAGRVTFIGPVVAAATRTANVRIELDNGAGLLKPDMYADVILQQPEGASVAVPDSAVMNTGTRSVVFVARGNGTFEPRQVVTGAKTDGFYAIRSGVQPGERVVVDANFLVDSESRLKSALSQMNGSTE
ncbi:MAG TPA: efflux RND transporter periplasmic adaptor subunit [Thermoanaerobaculia bacterium]|jgi:Cu(I)/Ag(I) efflux system membrane fusion protein|nr:efflux RND transporter periplasmic adaptor subunit [Thermoanaerobaculia bacterium]